MPVDKDCRLDGQIQRLPPAGPAPLALLGFAPSLRPPLASLLGNVFECVGPSAVRLALVRACRWLHWTCSTSSRSLPSAAAETSQIQSRRCCSGPALWRERKITGKRAATKFIEGQTWTFVLGGAISAFTMLTSNVRLLLGCVGACARRGRSAFRPSHGSWPRQIPLRLPSNHPQSLIIDGLFSNLSLGSEARLRSTLTVRRPL